MTFMFLDFWIRFSCICNISSTSLPSLCSNAKHTPTFRSIYDKTDRSGRYSATWFRGGSWKKTSDKVQIVLIVEKHVGTKTWSKPIGSYENGTHTLTVSSNFHHQSISLCHDPNYPRVLFRETSNFLNHYMMRCRDPQVKYISEISFTSSQKYI